MFTERELRTVLGNWDTGKNPTITDIYVNDGSKKSGSVWAVGSDYILKAGDRDALMKNIRIAKALHRQGFYSSLPVMTKDGKEILDGPGGQAFILIRSLKGTPLPRSEKFGDDRARYAGKYGISIARLHKALKSIQKDISPDEVDLYRNVSDWALPNVRQQNIQWSMGISDEFFSDYASGFGKLYDKLPKQLIHRDPNPGNILFDDGEVTGFIDFDLSECNIRLWDVCYCATGILAEDSNEAYEKWPEILGGILRGYDLEGKLTTEEKQAVFYVICSIQMICVAYFGSSDKFRELAEANRRMLKYIIRNREKIEGIFA
ncbi:MAG TPA: phosphotransferase [Clostridiales bacterium]|nr:phosphotransferase [Clostridiales bacterium]HPV01246.1 phosphotransferase [Clostridiales bacterium]